LSLPTTDQQCETLIEADIESSRQEDSTQPLPHMDARVLVVDDRRDVWRVSKYFLERCGASVEIAEDGQQAVDAVERAIADRNPFDLILMDMQMPVMNGREAVEELRRREVKTPVIAMTADAMDGERERCLEFGCDDYFPKPIDGPQLMSLCAKVIEVSKTGG
jgi:CheY-like chemotaxis protein